MEDYRVCHKDFRDGRWVYCCIGPIMVEQYRRAGWEVECLEGEDGVDSHICPPGIGDCGECLDCVG